MTDTVTTTKHSSRRAKRRGRENGVGMQPHKRTGIDIALAVLAPIMGQDFLDKYHLRDPLNRTLRYGTKVVLSTAAATGRQFKRAQSLRTGPTRLKASGKACLELA